MLYPLTTETRDIHSLDGIWQVRYDLDDCLDAADCLSGIPEETDEVAVPASLNEQTMNRAKYLHMGDVWYYRRFRLPGSWRGRRLFLRFGSVNYRAEVFLDGNRLGEHETGYTPFEFELPADIDFSVEHLLVVRVDNRLSVETVPQGNVPPEAGGTAAWRVGNLPNVHYDFFPFTGIHRPVMLYATGEARLERTYWTTQSVEAGGRARGEARFAVSGRADSIDVAITELGFQQEVALEDGAAVLPFDFKGVTLWSPASPKLYDIDIRVCRGGAIIDHYRLSFGFRTVEISGADILLNGEPVFLKGFGRHEDLAVIGKGLNLPFLVKDFNLMRWMGANSFRTSHYPYAEEQMQMADRQGFLVIGETAANTLSMCAVNSDPEAKERLEALHIRHSRELVERDYNHACVIGWSLGNECEMYGHFKPDGYFTRVLQAVKPLDRSRPFTMVSMAATFLHEIETMDAEEFDFIGYNAYPGWYFEQGKPQNIKLWLEAQFKQLWTVFKKPILLAEFGADALPGLHDEYNLMWTEEYQSEMLRQFLEFAEECPHCCGAHIWNFADFKVGQHTGRIVLNWKGLFTRDRHPKLAAHQVRRMWTGHEGLMQPPVEDPAINPSMLQGARYT